MTCLNKYDVGVITDGMLGCNIAFNLSANGYMSVLYNTDLENMQRDQINTFVSEIQEMGILASTSVEMTVKLLKSPRIVFVVSKSNVFTEDVLKELYALLEAGDIVIDTCDTNYKITTGRCRQFEKKEIGYIGTGFSGGEKEALSGVSLMVGGSLDAYNVVYEMLCRISSKYDGYPCCAYMGPDGAGQYVKMIHNGIEYGVAQSLSEAVSVLKHAVGCEDSALAELIHEWGTGDNESYFIQVLYDILNKRDASSGELIFDIASDKVGFDKTAAWLCSGASELFVPIPTIRAALDTRFILSLSKERAAFSNAAGLAPSDTHIINDTKRAFSEDVKNALYLSAMCVYVQAFALLKRASDVYIWGTDPLDAAITFQGGSFIRARLLSRIIDALRSREDMKHLFEAKYFTETVKKCAPSLRRVVGLAAEAGIPVPAYMASLSYIDSYASVDSEARLIELMRDYIQDTGFEMKNSGGKRFHADWHNIRGEIAVNEIEK